MADLEEMGFLEQPYTSAGRIPSDKGYRYYVNHLLQNPESGLSFEADKNGDDEIRVARDEIDNLRQEYTNEVKAVEEIIQETGQLLGSLTSYISLISSPSTQQSSFYRLQLVDMGSGQAVAVLVTDSGHIANRVIQVPSDASQKWLNQVSEYLSSTFFGKPLIHLASEGFIEIRRELAIRRRDYDHFFDLLLRMVKEAAAEKLYLGSTTQILNLPEFQDLEKMRSLLTLVETDHLLHQLLIRGEVSDAELMVRIGAENDFQEIENLSLVSAAYKHHGRRLGYLGILGPTRMDYPRVLTIVREVSSLLSDVLEKMD
jgi:heat-inducible transcriptional repressor